MSAEQFVKVPIRPEHLETQSIANLIFTDFILNYIPKILCKRDKQNKHARGSWAIIGNYFDIL